MNYLKIISKCTYKFVKIEKKIFFFDVLYKNVSKIYMGLDNFLDNFFR